VNPSTLDAAGLPRRPGKKLRRNLKEKRRTIKRQ
jgi:hypothetical protein